MRPVSRYSAMVASHLLLVNHFLFGLTYNSPMSPIHPNAIDGAFEERPHKIRHKKPPLVSYSLSANQDPETNSISLGDGCGVGCLHCSAVNGCLSCRSSFFLSLRRDGPRQLAFCERSCPTGYYKKRYNGKGYCASCRVQGCRECQSGAYCSRCEAGYRHDTEQGLCHGVGGNVSGPETSMPESDPQLPPIVDPPVLLTEEPVHRSSLNNATKKKKNQQRSGRRKLKRRNQGLLSSPLPRRKRPPHRRRRPQGERVSGVPVNRQDLLGDRGNSNKTGSRTELVGPRRRRGRIGRPEDRTGGTIERRLSRRRKLKKKHRKRTKNAFQMFPKKRSRGVSLENLKLSDRMKPLPPRQFQPEVTLARPSRHVLKEGVNATKPWILAGRNITRTFQGDPEFSDTNESSENVIERHIPDGRGHEAYSNLMNANKQFNDRTQTPLMPYERSRNVTVHKMRRLRFRRRRRRFRERKRKISEVK